MSPSKLRDVAKTVGGAGCPCCPNELPFMADIANRLSFSRSTTYRYLLWGIELGYIALGTRKRGKTEAHTFALTENGEAWLEQWKHIDSVTYINEMKELGLSS